MGKYQLLAIVMAFIIGFAAGSLTLPYTGRIIAPEGVSSGFAGLKMVTRIIDGDTVVIEGESVRLLGIDCDERGDPCYTPAKERLEELVLNREVMMETDSEDKDMYGRYLRHLILDGKNINLQMVKEGLAIARFSPGNVKYKEAIIQAEKDARENNIGCKWRVE